MMLFSATGHTGIHQLICAFGAAYQVSRCGLEGVGDAGGQPALGKRGTQLGHVGVDLLRLAAERPRDRADVLHRPRVVDAARLELDQHVGELLRGVTVHDRERVVRGEQLGDHLPGERRRRPGSRYVRVDDHVAAEEAAAPLVVVEGRVDVDVDHGGHAATRSSEPFPQAVAGHPSAALTGMVPAGAGRSGCGSVRSATPTKAIRDTSGAMNVGHPSKPGPNVSFGM